MSIFGKKKKPELLSDEEYKSGKEQYLIKLKHETVNKTFNDMNGFKIDGFKFRFRQPLDYEQQYAFIEFAETLDFRDLKSLPEVFIYLAENDIDFEFSYENSPNYDRKQNKILKEYADELLKAYNEAMDSDDEDEDGYEDGYEDGDEGDGEE